MDANEARQVFAKHRCAARLPKPERERAVVLYSDGATYRLPADFVWPSHRIAVKVSDGRRERIIDHSARNMAERQGWKFYLFEFDMIRSGSAIATLAHAFGRLVDPVALGCACFVRGKVAAENANKLASHAGC
jgi:hypothetical protein